MYLLLGAYESLSVSLFTRRATGTRNVSIATYTVTDPPRLLEYEWNVEPVSEMPHGERAIFRYELAEDGDSTRLLVVYRQISMRTARGFLPGLHAFLDRLEAQLDGRAPPDWMQRFGELDAEYPEWSEDASGPGK